jgi:hypothetical protein
MIDGFALMTIGQIEEPSIIRKYPLNQTRPVRNQLRPLRHPYQSGIIPSKPPDEVSKSQKPETNPLQPETSQLASVATSHNRINPPILECKIKAIYKALRGLLAMGLLTRPEHYEGLKKDENA